MKRLRIAFLQGQDEELFRIGKPLAQGHEHAHHGFEAGTLLPQGLGLIRGLPNARFGEFPLDFL